MTGGPNGLDVENKAIRSTGIHWLDKNEANYWIYERLCKLGKMINAEWFRYDLSQMMWEPASILRYGEGDHFTWHGDHLDSVWSARPQRKLTVAIQMSDPKDYTGGDMELFVGPEPTLAKKEQGFVMSFTSTSLHRVKPVESGERYSLIYWFCGPAFK